MTLSPLKSDGLTSNQHGFFGRRGGVSSGDFDSLNCGLATLDPFENTTENRRRVADTMSIAPANLLALKQIHSTEVIEVTEPFTLRDRPEADAMVSNLPNIGLGVQTADCAPILFCDPASNTIGAAHAGWKGAVGGIVENTVSAMIKLGAARENIRAVIGPCISQVQYEVGQEFLETFMDFDPDHSRFFVNGAAGKYQFDLPSFVLSQLNAQNIHSASWVKKCTYTLEDEYFSYRRKTHRGDAGYGTQISVITNSAR